MRFSIVTPSFRQSQWLKLCIESVADQGVDVEHLVQDAGSDDGTADWLRAERRVNPQVGRDAGIFDALNRGFQRSRGEVLGQLNCDEQFLPGTLAAVAEFFRAEPNIEMVFADVVVVDPGGHYLWHRKIIRPLLFHTWVCTVGTLTCALFFRRSVLESRRLQFDVRWKYCGDAEWLLRALQQGVRIAVLRRFASVYTVTGTNLSWTKGAEEESRALFATAPRPVAWLKPLLIWHHRLRRVLGGAYFQRPFQYSLYTLDSPRQRVLRKAARPTGRWRQP